MFELKLVSLLKSQTIKCCLDKNGELLCTLPQAEDGVTQQCWETIHWTSRMIPFGEFLGCGREVRDALLTLISELPPQPSTAEVCAQFFHDPGSVESISEKAKFKRLMAEVN